MKRHVMETIADLKVEQEKIGGMIEFLQGYAGLDDGAPAAPNGGRPAKRKCAGRGVARSGRGMVPTPEGNQHAYPTPTSAAKNRVAEQSAMPVKTADPPDTKLRPLSEAGVALAQKLPLDFTTDALAELLPLGKSQAYHWVDQWRRKGWIEKTDWETWKKTGRFGK